MIQEVLSPFMDDPTKPPSTTQSPNPSSPISSPSLSTSSAPSSHPTHPPPPPPQEPLRCPRCDSTNTKFCYYNNYNLTQPRHFCKTCRRYWTKGGALRNVPIGGGCRKAKVVPAICTKSANMKPKSVIGAHDFAPHTAQLVALLRATNCIQNPNPNPNLGINNMLNNGIENLYNNSNHGSVHHQFSNYSPMQQQRYQICDHQMAPVLPSTAQEMYQRFKSNLIFSNDQLQSVVGNVSGGFGSSMGMAGNGVNVASSLMDCNPLSAGDQLGFDLPAIHGVFP